MKIQENISLKKYNTFGIDAVAQFFVCVNTLEELKEVLQLSQYPNKFILGGGSNVLFVNDLDCLVILINLKGIKIISQDTNTVQIE